MAKTRIGQLAKELKIPVAEAIAWLKKHGVEVKTNLSMVEDAQAASMRAAFPAGAKATAGASKPAPRAKAAASGSAPKAAVKKEATAARTSPTKKTAAKPAAARKTAAKPAAARPAVTKPATAKPADKGTTHVRPPVTKAERELPLLR